MEWIKKLQRKPQKTKDRIMWITIAVIMTGVIVIWFATFSFDEPSFFSLSKLIQGIID